MSEVGIKALKNHLSAYVRAAASGECIRVTDRGQVVAELIAPRVSPGAAQVDQRLGELMQQGLLAPAKVSHRSRLPRRRPVATLAEVLDDLDGSRSGR